VNFLFSLLSFVFFLLLVSIIARGCVVCVKSSYACLNLLVSWQEKFCIELIIIRIQTTKIHLSDWFAY
jgi:hypothetical protein